MKVLDFYQKEREWSMGSIAERLYQFLVENREQRLADYPMLQKFGRLEDWDSLVYNDQFFPSTVDGLKAAMAAKYGEKQIVECSISLEQHIVCERVRVLGEVGGHPSWLPCLIIGGGEYWAVGDQHYRVAKKTIGDNVALTGGSKPKGDFEKKIDEVAIPFSVKTFSAGGGRVEAYETGYFFVPVGVPIKLVKAVK